MEKTMKFEYDKILKKYLEEIIKYNKDIAIMIFAGDFYLEVAKKERDSLKSLDKSLSYFNEAKRAMNEREIFNEEIINHCNKRIKNIVDLKCQNKHY